MKPFIKASFLVVMLHFISLPLLQSQTEAWQRINPVPVESSLNDCSLLPNNRIVAVGSNATVIYSDNFGADWEVIYTPDNISRSIGFTSVDFSDEMNGMAVGTYSSIIKTEDGGATWIDISPVGQHYDYKDVCFRNPSNCYITGNVDGSFLLHSSDGGATWDTAFQTEEGTFGQVQFVDENTGFLSSSGRTYFYKSIDGGENWELITINPVIEDLYVEVLNFINQDTGFIGGEISDGSSSDGIILKTTDGGNLWYQVFTDPFVGASKFFFINQDTGFTICPIIWYSNSVLKTTDGGESWEIVSDNLGDWFFYSLCMNSEGNGLIAGGHGQIFLSDDFGNNWEAAYSNTGEGSTITKAFITGDSTIVANFYHLYSGVPYYSAIQSFDRGATWTGAQFEEGISTIYYVNNFIGFYCGFYDVTDVGIYKTADGGGSWEFYDLGEGDFQPYSIEFIDDQTGFVAGTLDGYGMEMFRTDDQGETWVQVYADCFHAVDSYYPIELEFKDDSVGYIVGEIGMGPESSFIVTKDMGNTWEIDTLPFTWRFNGIEFTNPDTGFLYGYGKIVRTINGGQDWSLATVNMDDYVDFVSMSFPSDQIGYAINGYYGSNQSIFKTIDGGDTWNCIEAPTTSYILSVNFFTEDEGVILGENAIIFKTKTGGMVGVPDPGINPKPESVWKCYPNPFSSSTIISSLKDISGDIVISIFDFTGRPVRHYSGSSANGGETFFNWDGRDDSGNELSSGIYVVCINYRSSREMMKVIKF